MRDSNKIMRALFFVLRFWREQNAAAEWQANDRQGYYTFSTKKRPVLSLLLLLRTALLKQTIGEGPPIDLADAKRFNEVRVSVVHRCFIVFGGLAMNCALPAAQIRAAT